MADFWLTTMTKCTDEWSVNKEKGWWLAGFWLATMTKCTVKWSVNEEKGQPFGCPLPVCVYYFLYEWMFKLGNCEGLN